MGEVLYRKYRSRNFDEVVGQDHITTTLKNAIKLGKVSHAYLFTGPRGVGKTSIARILAYEVNKLPYDDKTAQLDIIEIDAASNRRIDEIRELRDRVHIAPAKAQYKVYIIDEVHMLTREAFNALLKTLEEPPQHAIFILATTEAHKLPETIISRTQKFTFKPVSADNLSKHLRNIARKENIQINSEALELIAVHGGGSFRDSISLLDQARNISSREVTVSDIETLLGLPPQQIIDSLFKTVQSGSPAEIADVIKTIEQSGYDTPFLASQLSELIRQKIVEGHETVGGVKSTHILKQLLEVPIQRDPSRYLEIILLEAALSRQYEPTVQSQDLHDQQTKSFTAPLSDGSKNKSGATSKSEVGTLLSQGLWEKSLRDIKQQHNTLYSVVRMARVSVNKDSLTLEFNFPFHKKQIDDPKNQQILSAVVNKHGGQNIPIKTILAHNETSKSKKASPQKVSSDTLNTITEIFGGGELLEE